MSIHYKILHFFLYKINDRILHNSRKIDTSLCQINTHTTTQQSKQCVHVFNINGIKGIKVKTCLEETNLVLLNQILDFATSNNLVIKYIGRYDEKSD
jgi:hypothetical protein